MGGRPPRPRPRRPRPPRGGGWGLPPGRLSVGAPADLVLFDPNAPFVLDRFALRSKSKNTPFDGARMEGRVIGTWVGGRRVFGEAVNDEAFA